MNLGTAQVIQGNALNLQLPDNSVDLICTSPPYFGLRSYQDAGQHYEGQIGSEATPQEFLDALIAATREMVRVLKPSGSIFVNLGDKYAGKANDRIRWGTGNLDNDPSYHPRLAAAQKLNTSYGNIRDKSLMGIPWRYALRCIDDLGLILRAEIIWAKPNGLPESVTDRVRRSHEQWFHFTKQPRYFAAVDEIREAHTGTTHPQSSRTMESGKGLTHRVGGTDGASLDPRGKLPGSVWTIPTQPLTIPPELGVDHFAAYPMEFPRRIILGWTPNGICTACGEGRRPTRGYDRDIDYQTITDKRINLQVVVAWCTQFAEWCASNGVTRRMLDEASGHRTMGYWWTAPEHKNAQVPTPEQHAKLATIWPTIPPHPGDDLWEEYERQVAWSFSVDDVAVQGKHRPQPKTQKANITLTGYMCGCPTPTAPTTPSVVCDPFGGTGTTALVAKALGRTGITIDLSADYCRLAEWRCNDPRELAAALQVEKPEPVHPDQLDLFSEAP